MRKSIFAPTYYQASRNFDLRTEPLRGDITVDACVIGGGYTGLSAALELAKAGYKTVVLESQTVGFGASGRNGGQVCTGFSSGQYKIEMQLGKDKARQCFAIAEDAKKLLVERLAEYEIDCDLTWGYIHGILKARQMHELEAWQRELEELGIEGTSLLSRQELEQRVGTTAYHGGLRESTAGHLHPLNYCLGLARAALGHGAIIHEYSPVIDVDPGAKPMARTTQGSVQAKYMIIAGNGYLKRTVKPLYGKVMPVGSYIIATEPLGSNLATSLIPNNEAVANTNFIVDYFRRSHDDRLLFGGRASYSTHEPSNLGEYMRPRMAAVFPQLKNVRIDYAWGGYIGITSNRIPDCGRLSPTVYYAHGYSGQGVALSGIYGKLMADAVRGVAERFDLLASVKHLPFPGGALRTPLLVAAMSYYRMRDYLS